MSVSIFFSFLPKYGLGQVKKSESDYNLAIIFTKKLLPVPNKIEVFTHKVPQLLYQKSNRTIFFTCPEMV